MFAIYAVEVLNLSSLRVALFDFFWECVVCVEYESLNKSKSKWFNVKVRELYNSLENFLLDPSS